MKTLLRACCLGVAALCTAHVSAETLYVTDKVTIGVFSQSTLEGDPVTSLKSADSVEVMGREGDSVQVKLEDGTEGWVKGSELESDPPFAVRYQALKDENDKLRAAARSESSAAGDLKSLQTQNGRLQDELAQARRELDASRSAVNAATRPADDVPVEPEPPPARSPLLSTLLVLLALAATGIVGFWAGYRTLEQRVRRKYGGLKVY